MPEEKELEWRSKPQQEADEIRRVNREQDEKYADSFDRQWDTPETPKEAGKEPSVSQRTKAHLPRRRSNNQRSNYPRGNNQRGNSQRVNARQPVRRRSKSPQDIQQMQTPRRRPPAAEKDRAEQPAAPRRSAALPAAMPLREDSMRASEEYPLFRVILMILAAFGFGLLLFLVGILIFRSCMAEPAVPPETSVYETQTGLQQTTTLPVSSVSATSPEITLTTITETAAGSTGLSQPDATESTEPGRPNPGVFDVPTTRPYEFPE